MLAKAVLSAQASSAPSERLFSDLGRKEGRQSQSMLSSTLEMSEIIRAFVRSELSKSGKTYINVHIRITHPSADAFRNLSIIVAHDVLSIVKNQ